MMVGSERVTQSGSNDHGRDARPQATHSNFGSRAQQAGRSIKSHRFFSTLAEFRLARRRLSPCSPPPLQRRVYPAVPVWMILIATFSVIILVLCWLCYSGDVNS